MNEALGQAGELVQQVLQSIAQAMGTTVEYVWPLIVKQQFLEGLALLSVAMLGLVVIILAAFMVKWGTQCGSDRYLVAYKVDLDEWWPIGCTIAALVGLFVLFGCGIDAMYHLLNPEYMALTEVLDQAAKLVP